MSLDDLPAALHYPFFLTGVGLLMLALAGVPLLLRRMPLSLPIVLVVLGALLAVLPVPSDPPDPREHPGVVERLTELVVIVSLMGAGLKLDTPLGLRRWAVTWRLLGVAMPLSIVGIALLGYWLVGLTAAAALLLGAALAPTDPVLAADVQVGPPGEGEEDRVRFALTSEAGLNDSLAFPFVLLALAAGEHAWSLDRWLLEWFAYAVVWKLSAGVAMGWLVGKLSGFLLFRPPKRVQLAAAGDGFLAVGVTLLAYGATELISGYGFLAVFCAGVTLRSVERNHSIHERLHDFTEETERLGVAALLVLFGAALVSGLAQPLAWAVVATAVAAIVVIRPLAALASLHGFEAPLGERLAIAFFGIRGVGSVYYLAYGINHAGIDSADAQVLWSVAAMVIALSILVHGTTATPVMRRFGAGQPDEDG